MEMVEAVNHHWVIERQAKMIDDLILIVKALVELEQKRHFR